MRKFTLFALAALFAGAAVAQEVRVGIERPLIPGGGRVYDDFAYITTADFNQSVDGLTVKFCQSPELEATLAKDETAESGFARSTLRYRGAGYDVDYVWKIQCTEGKATNHEAEKMGSENFTFGFDLNVASGKQFTVTAIELDLLLEQNPSWVIRLVDAAGTELYNTGWVTKTGGYNNAQWGAGWFGRFTTTGVSFETELNGGENGLLYYPCQETTTNIPENLVLQAGDYKVLCTVDYNNENLKGVSFDHLTIEGNVSEDSSSQTSANVFSWEAGVATGGTVVANGANTAVSESLITVSAKKANIADDNVTFTFDQPLEAGDVISITGYRKKDTDANGTLYFLFENGYTIDEGDNVVWNNIHENVGQQPNTNTYVVGEGAGSKILTLARSKASTNVFITQITITRGGTNDIDIPVVAPAPVKKADGAIYNFAGRRVENTVPGVPYIRNGKAFIAK